MKYSVPSFSKTGKEYIVDLEKNFCTCPSFTFQKVPLHARSCKHMQLVENHDGGGNIMDTKVKWKVSKPVRPYPLIAHGPSKTVLSLPVSGFTFSRKFDGVFARIDSEGFTLKSGTKYLLPHLGKTWPARFKNCTLDVEVCLTNPNSVYDCHSDVMLILNRGILHEIENRLRFMVIDYRHHGDFTERYNNLYHDFPWHRLPSFSLISRYVIPDGDMMSFLIDIRNRCRENHFEGVVVQSKTASYQEGIRDPSVNFKWKVPRF